MMEDIHKRNASLIFQKAEEDVTEYERERAKIAAHIHQYNYGPVEPISKILDLHVRALACHCECLGMNAENSMAVCGNYTPPYNDADYDSVMQKWGLMNEKGEPII